MAINNFGYPAFDHIHFMGNAFGGKIPLFTKQSQAPELRVGKLKPFTLILHTLLAALKQFHDKILKFIELILGNISRMIIRIIVHGENYTNKNCYVNIGRKCDENLIFVSIL